MKNTVLIAFLLITSLVSTSVIANGSETKPTTEAQVRHAGSNSSQYIFIAEVNNPTKGLVRVTISDEDGNEYFTETFREKKFSKQLLIEKDFLQDRNFIVEIYTLKSKKPVVYKIGKQVKVIQELQVEQINVK